MLKLAIVLILPAIVVMIVFKNYWMNIFMNYLMNIFESNTNGMSDKFQDKNTNSKRMYLLYETKQFVRIL